MAVSYGPYNLSDHANGLDSDALAQEVADSSIAKVLVDLAQDVAAGTYLVWFDVALSAAEETTLHGDATPPAAGSVLGDHDRAVPDRSSIIIFEHQPVLEAVEPGASNVVSGVTNGPAVECGDGASGYGASEATWPQAQHALAKYRIYARFVLKVAGTGSNVRIAAKAKAKGTGEDLSGAFDVTGVVVVPITHTNPGDIFEADLNLDASIAALHDSLIIHVGRDGDESMAGGAADDVNVPIHLWLTLVEAR